MMEPEHPRLSVVRLRTGLDQPVRVLLPSFRGDAAESDNDAVD
jgi:hypothetical protein